MPADWSVDSILAFVAANQGWGALVFGLMAFGESLAFIGVLVPATTVMLAAGALVGAGVVPLWSLWLGGAIGAALGDTVSYWVGRKLGTRVEHIWPFTSRPHWIAAGERVFARWGWAAVFFGRFIGPLRATVPLAAGILEMPQGAFQLANVGSAIVWIPVLVAPGAAASQVWALFREGHETEAIVIGVALLALFAGGWALVRHWAPRILGNGRDGGA